MRAPICTLVLFALLAGCQNLPNSLGPEVPIATAGAGVLTLANGSQHWFMPETLTFTGRGTLVWPDRREYVGDFVNGKPHGTGLAIGPGNLRYQGLWQNGLYHGHGELKDAAGAHYVGDFVAGQRSGSGVETSSMGLYKGLWLNDLPHGQGDFRGNNGESYAGLYAEGLREGYGQFTGADGTKYEGDWQQDKPHGFGELSSASGTTYTGQLHQGRQHGYGTQQDLLGNTYTGTWHLSKYHGYGELKRADGSRYLGEWHQGMRQGAGTEHFANGGSHQGEWEANQSQGPGNRTTSTGVQISGMFLGESLNTGLVKLTSGAEYAGRLFRRRTTEVDPGFVRWAEQQARKGDAQAQFLLGTFHSNFDQPQPDTASAIKWYERASGSYPEAAFRMGQLLLQDEPQRAVTYLQQAATKKHAAANLALGELFHSGQVVTADAAQAQLHYQTALANGSLPARNNLAWLLATSQEAHVRDPQRAIELIEVLAQASANWEFFDTLAAAYAAAGRFAEATNTQAHALSLLPTEYEDQRTVLSARLQLYTDGQAFVEVLEFAD